MSETADELKLRLKKLNAQATQAKIDLSLSISFLQLFSVLKAH